jgi:cardiolipin synthase
MEKNIVNVPNALSFYRLISFPVVIVLCLYRVELLFVTLLVINLVTDVLDGFIARVFDMQTEFGARLDSVADFGTYILAIVGVFTFKTEEIQPYLTSFFVFLGLFFGAYLLSLIRFKRFPSLHLYSWKIGGYIQGIFFFVLFVLDFNSILYYIMVFWGIIAFTEHIIIQLKLPEMRSNQKGLYWVINKQK